MADPFRQFPSHLNSPARNFEVAALSDTVDLPNRPRFLFIGVAGNISVIGDNAVTTTITVPAGQVNLSPSRIRATGTTATGIVCCW